MDKLKYQGYTIVFQEVPDEISLVFNISGCPYRCRGCHSQYLWDYNGLYLSDDIEILLKKYTGIVTCVCFMGGDQNQDELLDLCKIVNKYQMKTCLYTGANLYEIREDLLANLNYIKVGRYIEELGGLDKNTTNQRMYKICGVESIKEDDYCAYTGIKLDNITYRFNCGMDIHE